MIKTFLEIAFLTDRDLSMLLQEIENHVLIIALSQEYEPCRCNSFLRERILAQFSYIGWRNYEMDRHCFQPMTPLDVVACQMRIMEIANQMIQEHRFDDYHTSWRA